MDSPEWLERNEKGLISFTQALVRINSVNGNETDVARFISKKLGRHGIKSMLVGRGNRKNLMAEIGKGKRCLILCGHMDTVPLGDRRKWRFPPLSARIHKGRMYGRGAYDMKAGLASLVFTLIALKECRANLGGRVRLVLTWGEETGLYGMKELLRNGLRSDAAIVAEPTRRGNGMEIGSRGILRFELETTGKTAHSGSTNKRGINAVTKMAKLLLELERMRPRYRKHKLFPPPRVSPGTIIEAGEAINIIPDRCRAKMDCRLSYGQTDRTLLKDMQRIIGKIKKGDKEFRVRIRKLDYVPPILIRKDERIVKSSVKAFRKIPGMKPVPGVSGSITDGALLVLKGIPAVIFGPRGTGAHSENEYVEVKSILRSAKAYALAAAEFLKGGRP